MDQPDGFACNDGGDIEIACGLRRRIFGRDRFDILHELDLAAHPAARMIVDQAAAGERRRPDIVAGEIEDDAADAVAAGRGADASFRFLGTVAFLTGIKARAEQHAGSAQHHHRGEPAAIADTAGRRDRHPAGCKIDDRRHDVDRCARGAMAAGLGPLRDQNVGACVQSLPRHRLVLHLADQQRARGLDARRKRFGIAERQHDRARARLQGYVQQIGLFGEAPGNEADAERIGDIGKPGCLLLQPRSVAITAAENTKPAGGADGHGETCAGNEIHRRRQDRMLDAQAGGQRCRYRHVPSLRSGQAD